MLGWTILFLVRAALALALLTACGPTAPVDVPDGAPPDGAPADGARCADPETLEVCAGGACESTACRGDEVCEDAACVPWTEATLRADFTLDYSETVARRVIVTVAPGGFPRRHVEALRFDFGDGVAGWAEMLRHDYAAPGVYPITLEVRLRGHRILRVTKLAVIDPPSDHVPLRLTVNDIPDALNGSEPFTRGGVEQRLTLQVPTHGFVVNVERLEDPARPLERLSLTADVALGGAPAGAELIDRVVFDGHRGAWTLGPDEAAPAGPVTFTLTGRTADGAMLERRLGVEAVTLTPALDPFDRPMIWLFRTDRDFFDTRVTDATGGRFALASTPGADGEPDFVEELALIGAQGDDPEANARYLGWIREAIRAETYRYFGVAPDGTPTDDIPLTIFWQGEPGAPDPADFRADGDVSLMRFGGTLGGFLGFSGFSPHNEIRIDDSTADRGVATAALLSTLTSTPVVSEALNPIKPGTGTPVGAHEADREVLDPAFDPYAAHRPEVLARHDDLRRIARYLALAIASVTAHEMGHAMGLMPNGVPPIGYFGDVPDASVVNAARTDALHADFPGLNLMQSGGDYLGVLDEALATLELPRGADLVALAEVLALENRLGAYARAYLQRRLTYAYDATGGSGWSIGCR